MSEPTDGSVPLTPTTMPRPSTPTHSPHPAPPPSSSSLRIDQFKLTDDRKLSRTICRPPIVHVAHGFAQHLSFLRAGRPLICLSDWQLEPATQRHFWAQAAAVLREQLGPAGLARALVLVAGDMASAGDALRGVASDAVPQLEWLQETVSCGDVLLVYGNHDRVGAEHLRMVCAASGLPCVLPQGRAVTVPLHGASGTAATPTPGFSGGATEHKGFSRPVLSLSTQTTASRDSPQEEPKKAVPPHANAELSAAEPSTCTSGLSKAERAALYANCKFEKRPVKTKLERQEHQWRIQNPEQAALIEALNDIHAIEGTVHTRPEDTAHTRPVQGCARVAGVHGIPASHSQGMGKIERTKYFQLVQNACAEPIDILVTHSNPKLPGQEEIVKGDDARRLYENFMSSSALLHVHGHMHTEPAVTVLTDHKVVVNCDGRVVVFVPPAIAE